MSGFLYFVEGRKGLGLSEIEKLGLEYAFPHAAPECREQNMQSPTGKSGCLFADPERLNGKVTGFYPDEQTWNTFADKPGLAIGYYNDAKPRPEDLERESMVPGTRIRLEDENFWVIPEVREHEQGEWQSRLPCLMKLDENGVLVRGVHKPKYQELWDATAPIASELFEAERDRRETTITDEDITRCVELLLQANYVVSIRELVALGTLDPQSPELIVMLACRRKKLLEWSSLIEKKNTPSAPTGSTTSDGSED